MKTTKHLSIATALCMAISSLATSAWATGWNKITSGTINDVQMVPDGSFIISLVNFPVLCTGPTSTTWQAQYVQVSVPNGYTEDGVKSMLALIMGAKLGSRTVTIYANNNASNPTGAPCVLGTLDVF
jgi:hypothetical protein